MDTDPSKPPSNGSQAHHPGEHEYIKESELSANARMAFPRYMVISL